MSFLQRLFTRRPKVPVTQQLYAAIVNRARDPRWYESGGVEDSLDGRFDMLALVMSLVLIRLEREGEPLRQSAVELTECFIDDMDAQMREIGIGDLVVGKHVGKMMGALGGRIDAYGDALAGKADLALALVRNLYRGEEPGPDALAFATGEMLRLNAALAGQSADQLLRGELGG